MTCCAARPCYRRNAVALALFCHLLQPCILPQGFACGGVFS